MGWSEPAMRASSSLVRSPATLTETARFFGIGRDVDIGTETATGSVPEAESDVELAS